MITGEQYVESIKKINMEIYMFGERIESSVSNLILRPSLNSVKATYDLAQDPQHEDLMTATSHITGKKINRFCHIHQSTTDLIKKVKMQRLCGQKTASCFQRCVGMDAFNSIWSTTFETDQKHGTRYHDNFMKYMMVSRPRHFSLSLSQNRT
jgi:4-hydroxybutyryl-CoA dehydratase/vinylacetyl-CoA-Delta-isomerase